MIPKIPNQRIQSSNESKPFNDLVNYIEEDKGHQRTKSVNNTFDNIIEYSVAETDLESNEEKCVAIRTINLSSIEAATVQMNATAAKNTRCKDPAYHFILSWPEHEKPQYESIFDAAQHALNSLGLSEHEAVIAIHGNTDNWHAHVAVNRVHPVTFETQNIMWSKKTLHKAARESEIKHGWTHDNGIYIVETNSQGEKKVILNPEFAENVVNADRQYKKEVTLPTWHDPDSLESWLKKDVSKALKKQLPKMQDWPALHKWLNQLNIELSDTGSGLRLEISSEESGEKISMPASKGLRLLKRNELIARWGKFTLGVLEPLYGVESFPADPIPLDDSEKAAVQPSFTPDLSKFTQQQINKGIDHVFTTDNRNWNESNTNSYKFSNFESDRRSSSAQRRSGLYELSFSSMDGNGQHGESILPDALYDSLGNQQAWRDPDMRRAISDSGSGRSIRSLSRDNSKREERKAARALAREDLRNRYAQYKRFVREGDQSHWSRVKEIKSEYGQALKQIKQKSWVDSKAIKNDRTLSLAEKTQRNAVINMMAVRARLQAEANYQSQMKIMRATRLPPLGWRIWLQEQANLDDQAALSALRGIVYQAQRDAKKSQNDELLTKEDDGSQEYQEYQYKLVMARLLEQERKEVAIRSARADSVRPYEADALLRKYIGIKWNVTGNGNIEYNSLHGSHLFTDRGNRVTFDKVLVTDEEIKLALVHAQQKFGNQITLTGDLIFSARMAKLADDLGITVLNPELQAVVASHRKEKLNRLASTMASTEHKVPANALERQVEDGVGQTVDELITPTVGEEIEQSPYTVNQLLKRKVLSIDPGAEFEIPDVNLSRTYSGRIAASLEPDLNASGGFAQHIGRSRYALHALVAPNTEEIVDVVYKNGKASVAEKSAKEADRQKKR